MQCDAALMIERAAVAIRTIATATTEGIGEPR
jgi:hypothetical protein